MTSMGHVGKAGLCVVGWTSCVVPTISLLDGKQSKSDGGRDKQAMVSGGKQWIIDDN